MRPSFPIPQLSGKGRLHAPHSASQWRGPVSEDVIVLSLTELQIYEEAWARPTSNVTQGRMGDGGNGFWLGAGVKVSQSRGQWRHAWKGHCLPLDREAGRMFQGERSTRRRLSTREAKRRSKEERVIQRGWMEPRCAPAEKTGKASWGQVVAELRYSALASGMP